MRQNWKGNPLDTWLTAHNLTPCQLAVAAAVDVNIPYNVLNGYTRRLPQNIIEAVDTLDGEGAGDKLNRAYGVYRDGMAHDLLTKV